MDLEVLVTPGLGDNSYLIASGDEAAVVDPQRDVGRFLAAAEGRGVAIRHVLETHVHNDYLSGALELRAATGAAVAAPARGGYEFPVDPMAEGDELKLGDIRLMAMETPGHTPEHLSYLLFEAGAEVPAAVFTGGSLMVGNAGRTDLLGPERADELTRAQFRSLRRLAALPDDVRVFPTHGAGSFCGSGPSERSRTSTMGLERGRNPALTAPSEDAFVRQQLAGLLAFPNEIVFHLGLWLTVLGTVGLMIGYVLSPVAVPPGLFLMLLTGWLTMGLLAVLPNIPRRWRHAE